ncbi:MAG: hypothetical protein IPL65_22570 [Lewinellaceae bacterium]|nr:hypothetical protein [Lewinellaceae bacterium]
MKNLLIRGDLPEGATFALKFKNKLQQNPEWERFILESPAWMRLLTVLLRRLEG